MQMKFKNLFLYTVVHPQIFLTFFFSSRRKKFNLFWPDGKKKTFHMLNVKLAKNK